MTRRTRNNPSPSGLKSLSYGPKKRGQKKAPEEASEQPPPPPTSTTSDKKPAATKKRSRANSKPADAPPAKKRAARSRHAKTIEVEVPDDEHDADDDEAADMAMASYKPAHPSSSYSHAQDKPLGELRQETEDYSSREQSTDGHNLEDAHLEHGSEEDLHEQEQTDGYESQDVTEEEELRETVEGTTSQQLVAYESHDSPEVELPKPVSGEFPSDDILPEPKQSVRSSNSQEQHTPNPASPTARASTPPSTMISRPYIHKPHFLTPKPTKPKQKTLGSTSTTPKAPNTEPAPVRSSDRLQASSPLARSAMKAGARSGAAENQEDEEDPDQSISFLDPPVLTAAKKDEWREQQRIFRGEAPRSSVAKKNPAAKTSQYQPNAARALIEWAERDDIRKPPTPREMTALLEGFEARGSANITERSRSRSQTVSRNRLLPAPNTDRERNAAATPRAASRATIRRQNGDRPEVQGQESKDTGASIEANSEVPAETQPPKTPTAPASTPQESGGFWSGMSAMTRVFATPLRFFDRRRNQDSPAADASGSATNGAQSTDPVTPSRPVTRPRASQTERRNKAPTARNKRPQTERSLRHKDQPKPPIHLRGILTPDRAAEIHREQDRLAAARGQKRRAVTEQTETEETESENASMTPARVGEKRKRTKGAVRTPPACSPGTFRVPSPSSSDDSGDEEEAETEKEEERPYRIRYTPMPVTPRRELINDDGHNASPFGSVGYRLPTKPFWEIPEGWEPTYKEYLDEPKTKAKTSPKKTSPQRGSPQKAGTQRTSPQKTSPKRAGPKYFPGKKSIPPISPPKKRQAPVDSDSDGSFKVPLNDSGSDGDEELTQDEGSDTAQKENQAPAPSALQSKQWTQTPPPKPRPSNAQLPQATPHSASAEAAKARAEKFKPKQPSSLRNVTQMSPMQMEKENIMLRSQVTSPAALEALLADTGIPLAEWQETNDLHDRFFSNADPEVVAAVNGLPDDQIVEYPLPPSLSSLRKQMSEVEKEVERIFT